MLTKSNVPFKVKQKKLVFEFLDVHQPKTSMYLDQVSKELNSLVGYRRHKILGEIQKRVARCYLHKRQELHAQDDEIRTIGKASSYKHKYRKKEMTRS